MYDKEKNQTKLIVKYQDDKGDYSFNYSNKIRIDTSNTFYLIEAIKIYDKEGNYKELDLDGFTRCYSEGQTITFNNDLKRKNKLKYDGNNFYYLEKVTTQYGYTYNDKYVLYIHKDNIDCEYLGRGVDGSKAYKYYLIGGIEYRKEIKDFSKMFNRKLDKLEKYQKKLDWDLRYSNRDKLNSKDFDTITNNIKKYLFMYQATKQRMYNSNYYNELKLESD